MGSETALVVGGNKYSLSFAYSCKILVFMCSLVFLTYFPRYILLRDNIFTVKNSSGAIDVVYNFC